MREDHLETLDRMFPGGYAIAYSCPDGQMRFSHYDPTKSNDFIRQFHDLAKEISEKDGP